MAYFESLLALDIEKACKTVDVFFEMKPLLYLIINEIHIRKNPYLENKPTVHAKIAHTPM